MKKVPSPGPARQGSAADSAQGAAALARPRRMRNSCITTDPIAPLRGDVRPGQARGHRSRPTAALPTEPGCACPILRGKAASVTRCVQGAAPRGPADRPSCVRQNAHLRSRARQAGQRGRPRPGSPPRAFWRLLWPTPSFHQNDPASKWICPLPFSDSISTYRPLKLNTQRASCPEAGAIKLPVVRLAGNLAATVTRGPVPNRFNGLSFDGKEAKPTCPTSFSGMPASLTVSATL